MWSRSCGQGHVVRQPAGTYSPDHADYQLTTVTTITWACHVTCLVDLLGALNKYLVMQEYAKTQDQLTHFLTYADNNAVGYFAKQGFTKEITLDKEWVSSPYICCFPSQPILHDKPCITARAGSI